MVKTQVHLYQEQVALGYSPGPDNRPVKRRRVEERDSVE